MQLHIWEIKSIIAKVLSIGNIVPTQTSSETRLKPIKNQEGKYELGEWVLKEYDDIFVLSQQYLDIETTFYANIFTSTTEPIYPPSLLNDYDSTAEAMILNYISKNPE